MPSAAKPRRVPLLWILLPYATGIAIARFQPLSDIGYPLLIAIVAGGLSYVAASSKLPLWHLFFVVSITSLGAIRFSSQEGLRNEQAHMPPREAVLELRIETLFNATDPDTTLGIAQIVQTPPQQNWLTQRSVFFFLDTDALTEHPQEGETFKAIGVVRPLRSYSDGDRFDAYLRNLGIGLDYKQGYILSKSKESSGSTAFFNHAREHFSEILSRNSVPESEYTGALKGLMLGQKSELSPEQKQLFLSNGTMHLFAISGLHIGVITVCFHTLLTVLRFTRKPRAILTLTAVALFVLVTGGSASSWRALLMVACFYLANFSQKQNAPVNALALSALIYLLLSPGQLFQAGFQMSYLTVTAILLLGLPLAKTLNHLVPLYRDIPQAALSKHQKLLLASKNWILDATGVSTAAFLVSAMLGIYYFQILPTYGILINLVALPLASLAIIAGFLSLLFSPLIDLVPISEFYNNAAIVLIKLIHLLLEFTSTLPYASIATPSISALTASLSLLGSLFLIGYCYQQSNSKASPLWQLLAVAACAAIILILQA
ncbi:ComEC/Rec2 family competence protein [Pelagicoccus mobilis]|uniref:ComEC/Rec2 family competence protein n=1 Tax=Pelagicoccus mobilis TaxID=415221 RepID=A0A934VRW5_9BACT|nr:ComEC/Rec2 family competence protein [Pelagicoccus mobilis]MBK1878390.1 ComEC/Rec2 family competence protein [Pelagicoccus mobilis]